jgi:hypothetical protein
MDAISADWSDYPAAETALADADYLELVNELWAELRRLWDTRDSWEPTLAVFSGLEAIAKEAFAAGGLIFSTLPDGRCHILVP